MFQHVWRAVCVCLSALGCCVRVCTRMCVGYRVYLLCVHVQEHRVALVCRALLLPVQTVHASEPVCVVARVGWRARVARL